MAASMTSAAPSLSSPVGVIAGGGAMPFAGRRVSSPRAASRRCCSRCVAPAIRRACSGFAIRWISVGQLGRATRLFRDEGCRDLIFIGTLVRPALSEIRLDWGTLRLLGHVVRAFRGGDDHLLSSVGRILEQQGSAWSGSRTSRPIS